MKERIIAVSGGFDPLHVGHVRMMQAAAALGTKLVVIVNRDEFLLKKKGYVFMPLDERMEMARAIKGVDEVVAAIDTDQTVCETLRLIKPHVFAILDRRDPAPFLKRSVDLVKAVIQNESAYDPSAISSAGAMGLMQLMPGTAKMLGVEDPFDPVQNLEGGIKYLSQLADKYNGDLTKTLAAYNAGPGRVDAYGGIPPFAETQKYVRGILALYERNNSEGDS